MFKMCNFLVFLLCVLLVNSASTITLDELCLFNENKTNNCDCQLNTDVVTHLPVLNIDCSWMDLKLDPGPSKIVSNAHAIDFSHNFIETLNEPIASETLVTLVLSFNKITTINVKYFQNVPNLERLDLSHNKISNFPSTTIFNNLKKLKYLNLSYNNINLLPGNIFVPLQNLLELNLGYNELGHFLMMHNNVLNATLGLNKNLEKLHLSNVSISNLHNSYFDEFHHLKFLSLADNPLNDVPSIPYSVTYLDLSGTNITVLAARHLNYHSLQVLKLNRLKELYMIDRYAFYNLQSLQVLSINDCRKLKNFNDLVFGIISQHLDFPLKKLSISRTGLETINSTYGVLFEKLEYLDLSHNHWKCDCGLLWLQKYKNSFKDSENMRCLSPYNFARKKIMDLQPVDLNCNVDQTTSYLQKALLPILIIVIFILICLIVYLIYMGPMLYRNKFRGIGPLSPYGVVTTQTE